MNQIEYVFILNKEWWHRSIKTIISSLMLFIVMFSVGHNRGWTYAELHGSCGTTHFNKPVRTVHAHESCKTSSQQGSESSRSWWPRTQLDLSDEFSQIRLKHAEKHVFKPHQAAQFMSAPLACESLWGSSVLLLWSGCRKCGSRWKWEMFDIGVSPWTLTAADFTWQRKRKRRHWSAAVNRDEFELSWACNSEYAERQFVAQIILKWCSNLWNYCKCDETIWRHVDT